MKFPISYFHLNPNKKKRMFRIGHIDVPEHIMSLIAFKQASDPFKKELRNNFFSKESIIQIAILLKHCGNLIQEARGS